MRTAIRSHFEIMGHIAAGIGLPLPLTRAVSQPSFVFDDTEGV